MAGIDYQINILILIQLNRTQIFADNNIIS